jgi:hypothetical protein
MCRALGVVVTAHATRVPLETHFYASCLSAVMLVQQQENVASVLDRELPAEAVLTKDLR